MQQASILPTAIAGLPTQDASLPWLSLFVAGHEWDYWERRANTIEEGREAHKRRDPLEEKITLNRSE